MNEGRSVGHTVSGVHSLPGRVRRQLNFAKQRAAVLVNSQVYRVVGVEADQFHHAVKNLPQTSTPHSQLSTVLLSFSIHFTQNQYLNTLSYEHIKTLLCKTAFMLQRYKQTRMLVAMRERNLT